MWLAAATIQACALCRKPTATVTRNGMRISCGTLSGQGSYCAIAGLDYEPELRWVLAQLKMGDLFIDVGANIGIYSVFAARKVGEKGRVFAIEPSEGASAMIKKNVHANGLSKIVNVIKAAASDQPGSLYISGNSTQWNTLQLSPSPPGERVAVTTIDQVLTGHGESNGKVRCIKIDAEGVETQVLRGAKKTLQKHKPMVVFENLFDNTKTSAAERLKSEGYHIGVINNNNRFEIAKEPLTHRCTNLVAIHGKNLIC
jgi:FkbM family methyltransferase